MTRLNLEDEKVFAFRWKGKFDEESFRKSLEEFIPEFLKRDRMNIYVEMQSIDGAEATAIWKDLKFAFNNYEQLLNKIDKVALVTDKGWMRILSDISSAFIQGVKEKSFSLDEADIAKEWVKR
ncbi:MAG: STAS/SEC14 domain-containing protein [Bacteroidia bacterium]